LVFAASSSARAGRFLVLGCLRWNVVLPEFYRSFFFRRLFPCYFPERRSSAGKGSRLSERSVTRFEFFQFLAVSGEFLVTF
jgi:hypothetical protein